MQHCWHDVATKYPTHLAGTTSDSPLLGRVCCHCGQTGLEPLPRFPEPRRHGPYVEDPSERYVLDDAECPGMGLIAWSPEVVVVEASTHSASE